jgi:hypothetical protein
MPFENVEVLLPNGQKHGPVDWATLTSWARQGNMPPGTMLVDAASREKRALSDFPQLAPPATANPYQSPLATPGMSAAPGTADEPVSYIIPYKNAPALISYYLGIFSLVACIPLLGFVGVVMGFAALVLGIKGLRLAAANPQAHGRVHAWIGIICGPICALVGLFLNVGFVIAMLAAR